MSEEARTISEAAGDPSHLSERRRPPMKPQCRSGKIVIVPLGSC